MSLPPAIAPFPMIDMLLTAFIFILFLVIKIYIKKFIFLRYILIFCWKGGIRTPVLRRDLIYSQAHLATLPPSNIFVVRTGFEPVIFSVKGRCPKPARRTDHYILVALSGVDPPSSP